MMNVFALQVFLSFILAGLWISGATLVAERLGSRLGGLIANLPSNIVISYIFIALANDARYAADATVAVPVGMLVDTVFLLILIVTLRWNIVVAVVLSLMGWFGLAWLAANLGAFPLIWSVPVYLFCAVGIWTFLEYGMHIPSVQRVRAPFMVSALLSRALFAGSVVGTTVLLSRFLPPYWVGLISTFPAVLLSSMVILATVQGPDFARATGKVLVLSSTNIIVYALIIRRAYPEVGILLGTLLGFTGAVLAVWLMRPVVDRISRSG